MNNIHLKSHNNHAKVKVPSSGQVEFRVLRNGNEDEVRRLDLSVWWMLMRAIVSKGDLSRRGQVLAKAHTNSCAHASAHSAFLLMFRESLRMSALCSLRFSQGPSKDDQRNAKNTWLAEGIPAETSEHTLFFAC